MTERPAQTMRHHLGKNQRILLASLAGIRAAIIVGDTLSDSLVRRGLLAAEPDGSFAHITAAGLRALADEIDAGRVKLFAPKTIRRPAEPA